MCGQAEHDAIDELIDLNGKHRCAGEMDKNVVQSRFVTSEYWRRISSCKVLGISVLIRVISRTHHCRGLKAMKFSTGKRKRDITSLQTCVYRLSFLIFV